MLSLGKCLFRFSVRLLIGLFLNVIKLNELYILEIKPLLVASFLSIFSQAIGCLFILFVVSFVVQKVLSLSRSHLFVFAFISIILGDRSKNTLLQFMSESVLPTFSSRSCTVSSLAIMSLIHFD